VTYGLVIYLLVTFKPSSILLKVELLQWIALAVLLHCFSLIGGYISSLRNNLRKSHTELKGAMAKIQEMAIRDDLTGLFNRRHLMNLLYGDLYRKISRADEALYQAKAAGRNRVQLG
jgi:diguanylate cyclase